MSSSLSLSSGLSKWFILLIKHDPAHILDALLRQVLATRSVLSDFSDQLLPVLFLDQLVLYSLLHLKLEIGLRH